LGKKELKLASMLTIFGKKKLSDERVANIFVNSLLETVEKGFPEVAGFINDSPEFVSSPHVESTDYGRFLMIVLAGNLSNLGKHFQDGQDRAIMQHSIRKFASVFDMENEQFARMVKDYRSFMSRVNHPSKNVLYAMSKAMFFKYELNAFQVEYFRNLNTPNPIFLKNLDEVMNNFLWDWDAFEDKYKVVAQ
jgi:hypothetical protein